MLLAWFVMMTVSTTQAATTLAYEDVVVWQAPNPPQRHWSVVVVDNTIAAIGPKETIPIPANAHKPIGAGAWITLGLIDGFSRLGMCGLFDPLTPYDQPSGGKTIQPHQRGADGWDRSPPLLAAALREGIVAALVAPYGTLLHGHADWLWLADSQHLTSNFPEPSKIIAATIHHGIANQLGTTKAQLWSLLRRILQESKSLSEHPNLQYNPNPSHWAIPVYQLLALAELWHKQGILLLSVETSEDIVRAIDLQRQYNIRLVVHGAYGAARLASKLAKAKIAVMVQPSLLLPTSLEREEAVPDLPQQLHAAGVPLLFTAGGGMCFEHTRLRQEAAIAVARGLDENIAFAAVTQQPRLVLQTQATGTKIESKALADFVVWSGHPLDLREHALAVWIGGQQQKLVSVQQLHTANQPTGIPLACSLRAGDCL